MPLYLDEIWLPSEPPETLKRALTAFTALAHGEAGYPPGVTVAAGPWFSNEEPKVVLVLDIADHTTTFPAFSMAMLGGLLTRRRLTPIVGWDAVERLLATL